MGHLVAVLILVSLLIQEAPDSLLLFSEELSVAAIEQLETRRVSADHFAFLAGRRFGTSLGWANQLRLAAARSAWSSGFIVDRDAGEARLADHMSGFLALKPVPWLGLILGDFRSSAGAGLSVGGIRFGTPLSERPTSTFRRESVRPYAGTSQSRAQRGLALEIRLGDLHGWIWAARRRLDGTADSSGYRITDDGVHVTALQRMRRLAVPTRSTGVVLAVRRRGLSLGFVGHSERIGQTFEQSWEAYFALVGSGVRFAGAIGGCNCARASLSAVGVIVIQRRARGPAVRLLVRRYENLPRLAAPSAVRGGRSARERGITLSASWPLGFAKLIAALDQSWSTLDRRSRARLSITFGESIVLVERRFDTKQTKRLVGPILVFAPGTKSGSWLKARIRSRRIPAPTVEVWAGVLDGNSTGAIRASVSGSRGPVTLDAGVTEYHKERGGPILVLYEPHTRYGFPLVQLTGLGRRYHLRIRLQSASTQLGLVLTRRRNRPMGPTESEETAFEVEFGLVRRFCLGRLAVVQPVQFEFRPRVVHFTESSARGARLPRLRMLPSQLTERYGKALPYFQSDLFIEAVDLD